VQSLAAAGLAAHDQAARDFMLIGSAMLAAIDYNEAGSCLMEDSVDRLVGE
jgi:hypothetical protein